MNRIAVKGGVALCVLLGVCAFAGDVVINEIMYHAPSDLDGDEYIELLNVSGASVDIGGWCLDGVELCFPGGTVIEAGQFLVLAADAARFEATYGLTPAFVYQLGLSNDGERVALVDATLQIIDQVTYSDEHPWPVTPDGLGPSLEVLDAGEDNSTPRNWRAGSAPSPGAGGGRRGQRLDSRRRVGGSGVADRLRCGADDPDAR